MKQALIVVDPIPFLGGSKIASEMVLDELREKGILIRVVSRNPHFWKHKGYDVSPLYQFPFLEVKEQGFGYYLKHLIYATQVFFRCLFSIKNTQIVGISGPGVDLSMYLSSFATGKKCIQMIHGPVAQSRSILYCLKSAHLIACLESEYHGIQDTFKKNRLNRNVIIFQNGLNSTNWPATTVSDFSFPCVIWAASLLKWKGLDFCLKAFEKVGSPFAASICYIQPKSTAQPCSSIPKSSSAIKVFESPKNLDEIRSQANIFISTSYKEPFGLSILEALAAGLCVILPRDGAYWDQVLTDGKNCIKYEPNNVGELANVIELLAKDMTLARVIGQSGMSIAEEYTAEQRYGCLVNDIVNSLNHPAVLNKSSVERLSS